MTYHTNANLYLATLRLIPDDIVLSMASREFEMHAANTCVCGWALREAIGRQAGIDAGEIDVWEVFPRDPGGVAEQICSRLASRFGGESEDWRDIFKGVCDNEILPSIEEAFVYRVREAAGAL